MGRQLSPRNTPNLLPIQIKGIGGQHPEKIEEHQPLPTGDEGKRENCPQKKKAPDHNKDLLKKERNETRKGPAWVCWEIGRRREGEGEDVDGCDG